MTRITPEQHAELRQIASTRAGRRRLKAQIVTQRQGRARTLAVFTPQLDAMRTTAARLDALIGYRTPDTDLALSSCEAKLAGLLLDYDERIAALRAALGQTGSMAA